MSAARALLRVNSMVHVYNCFRQDNVVLLSSDCLEVFVRWHNLIIFNKIKYEPWQQVTYAYYERWSIFMVICFETCLLPWFKAKWKEAGEDVSQPGTLYTINRFY